MFQIFERFVHLVLSRAVLSAASEEIEKSMAVLYKPDYLRIKSLCWF